jgi:hypothetical protein
VRVPIGAVTITAFALTVPCGVSRATPCFDPQRIAVTGVLVEIGIPAARDVTSVPRPDGINQLSIEGVRTGKMPVLERE